MRKLLLITTGGTIACGDTSDGRTPIGGNSAQPLLERLDFVPSDCVISAVSPFSLDSTDMTPDNWVCVAGIIREKYNDYDGFVVTHGTDTLAYAASALSCLIQNSTKPVVLTGSMLPMLTDGTDAKENLQNALAFACDERSHGVTVVFRKWAYDGRRVSKVHTVEKNAFESVNYPPIAYFDNCGINFAESVCEANGECEVQFFDALDKCVEAVYLVPGVVPHKVAKGTKAVVVMGFGVGGIPCGCMEWLEELVSRGVYVIMSTQVLRGGTDLSLYEVGSRIISRYPVLCSGKMTVEYALVRIMWALAYSNDYDSFKKLFCGE